MNYIVNQTPASFGERLPGHDDWSNLIYDFRSSPDYVDGDDFLTIPQDEELPENHMVDVRPPTCSIDSPTDGQTFPAGATISILASAGADGGAGASLVRVEFYNDATKLGEDTMAPYQFTWPDVPAGSYTLSVRAIDNFGLVGVSENVNIIAGDPPEAGGLSLYTMTPCRVYDSRETSALANGETREISITGLCGVPLGVRAVATNLTVVGPSATGWLTIFPAGVPMPGTSSVNYSAGRNRANNAILTLSQTGRASVFTSGSTIHFIIDVVGYFY